MKRLLAVLVPNGSTDFFINNIGSLRYTEKRGNTLVSSCVEPHEMGVYLEKEKHVILGFTIGAEDTHVIIEEIPVCEDLEE